ncbi:hypothetical protein BN1708_013105, partial [Verticillium longisporum]
MATGGRSSQPPTPGHTPLSDDLVRVAFEDDADVTLNGKEHSLPLSAEEHPSVSSPVDAATEDVSGPRKRRRVDSNGTAAAVDEQWVISAGHWRLRIRGAQGGKSGVEVVLVPVKLEAYSSERSRNAKRGFLRR